jgi:hypothetical protein
VVSKFPDFPRDLSIEEKAVLFNDMIREMIAYFRSSGLACEGTGPGYVISRAAKHGPGRCRKWHLHAAAGPVAGAYVDLPAGQIDVLVSFGRIAPAGRRDLDGRRTVWFDIEAKERADPTNDLAEEAALFLRRYGIRFFRTKGAL